MKYIGLIAILLTLAVFPYGCGTPAVAPKTGFQSVASETENKIIFIRRDGQQYTLNKYVKVVKEKSGVDENSLYYAAVILNNNRYKVKNSPDLICDVQFVFLDGDGFEVEKTNWQPVVLNPGVDTMVKQVAMNAGARDHKIYVREPKTSKW